MNMLKHIKTWSFWYFTYFSIEINVIKSSTVLNYGIDLFQTVVGNF